MKRKTTVKEVRPAKKQRTTSQPRMAVSLAPEVKYMDVAFATDATTTTVVVPLNSIPTGDTALTRDGNKVAQRALELRVRMELEAITQNAVARFVVVHDKNANVAAPIWATVFDSATPESLRLIATLSRYTILMDKTVTINNNSGATQKGFFKKWIKIPPELQLVTFADSGTGVPVTGSLTLMYLSDVAAGATDLNVNGQARLRFIG